MKKSSLVLLLATVFFGAVTYYFMYYADGGADGLSSFMFIILFGVLAVCLLLAFLLSLFLREGQSKTTRNFIIGTVIVLPIVGILGVTGVFGYFNYDYQNQWKIQVESDKSALSTVQFRDEDFGVTFNHVSGNISSYENGNPIPTAITPKIENGMLLVPSDDNTYLEPDVLLKLENNNGRTLQNYLEVLTSELKLDVEFEKGDLDDFPNVSKETTIWVLDGNIPYENREQLGKYFLPKKTGQSDIIYFLKSSKNSKYIWVLIVSTKALSAPAVVEKMSTDNFGDENLWFHTLQFLD